MVFVVFVECVVFLLIVEQVVGHQWGMKIHVVLVVLNSLMFFVVSVIFVDYMVGKPQNVDWLQHTVLHHC